MKHCKSILKIYYLLFLKNDIQNEIYNSLLQIIISIKLVKHYLRFLFYFN